MTTWDEQIEDLRRQISELQAARRQNEQIVIAHTQSLSNARSQLEKLLNKSGTAADLICEFAESIHAANPEGLLGWLLLDKQGCVLMHNPAAQRLLLDSTNGRVACENLCDARTGFPLSETELPWHRCLAGDTVSDIARLIVRRPDVAGELYLETTVVPLRKGKQTIGAWILFLDNTEAIKASEFIHNLSRRFEQYLSSAEGGHRDLKSLSEKLGVAPSTMAAEPVSAETAEEAPCHTILIVDDIPVNQKLLAMQLRNMDLKIEYASDGNEATEMVKRKQYSLVFMDCDMPVLDGLQATELIRQMEKSSGTHVKIVAMTSYDHEGDRERCLAHGMDDYLVKGSGKARVRDIIDQYVFGRTPETPTPEAAVSYRTGADEDELDLEWLEENFGKETQGIILLFLGTASALLNCMEFAFETKDAQAIRHFSYSLKGLFANFRLTLVARLAGQLSEDAANGLWQEAYELHQRLRRFLSGLKTQTESLSR